MEKSREPVYYSDYLKLDKILDAQFPKSNDYGKPAHDEMLFIIIHQTYELWFKQILHEMGSIIEIFKQEYIKENDLGTVVIRLERVIEIQKVLIEQVRILETMTPLDFLDFRDYLLPASGFQSFQFRILENKLGLPSNTRLKYNKNIYHSVLTEEHKKMVEETENSESLFYFIEKWLERTPFVQNNNFVFINEYKEAVYKMLESDKDIINKSIFTQQEKEAQLLELEKTKENFEAIFNEEKHNELIAKKQRRFSYKATQSALFINLYRDFPILHVPFKILTYLLEMDELFSTWRYRHAVMVYRMIGTKIGTGGSSGYSYLKATIDAHRIFPDLFNLSTFLIPRSTLPALPEEIKNKMSFS
ncbi:MAG: tryptophan 2,3-dioxygenase family protein [Candidatus Sericytochromatia bacterium]